MFTYGNGLAIAFLIWLFYLVVFIYSINSRQSKNLRKIGQRISWLSLTPVEASLEDFSRPIYQKFLIAVLIQAFSFIWIFLSWVYVGWVVCVTLFVLHKNLGMPQSIREFRWKLKNLDMNRDQLIKELMILNEIDVSDYEAYQDGFMESMRERGLV